MYLRKRAADATFTAEIDCGEATVTDFFFGLFCQCKHSSPAGVFKLIFKPEGGTECVINVLAY